ncbi:MAG: FAD-binding protein [Deltaproteobacteria bacterium]
MAAPGGAPIRIAVLLKQVPEVTEQAIDPATGRLQREGVELLMNPFDRRASLEACRIREDLGGGHLIALTMGPPAAESVLRECLAIGFDEAVHLSDRGFAGADTLATARALAHALEELQPDLILAGRYSIDSETGQVPGELAALLGTYLIPGARRLTVEATAGTERGFLARAECESDEGAGEVEAPLPAVVTCTDRWKTRIPRRLPDEEAGAQGEVRVLGVADLRGDASDYGVAGSPTSVDEVRPVTLQRRGVVVQADDSLEAAVDAIVHELDQARQAAAGRPRGLVPSHTPVADPRGGIFVVGELAQNGSLRAVTAELLGAADKLAARQSCAVLVVLQAPPLPDGAPRAALASDTELAVQLGALGADLWLRGGGEELPGLAGLAALEAAIVEFSPSVLLGPATSLGRDQLPMVAARLGLGLTGDAIGIEVESGGVLLALKPAFGGQLIAPIRSRTQPAFATLRAGVLEPALADATRAPATELRVAPSPGGPQARWLNFESETDSAGADLEEARIVVCAGFGMGGAEHMGDLARLATALGGTVCATRRVCDLGWLARQVQVGLSGRSIAPDVYLGFGVRGSFNHTVGIRRAGTVIGINTDPSAAIFAAADLGIVGDATQLLGALLTRLGA